MGLAGCASALLLSVTNHLTQNMAAIPFLWVLPLSLYLLSFILCFDSDRWYKRWLFVGLGARRCREWRTQSRRARHLGARQAIGGLLRDALRPVHGVPWRVGAAAAGAGLSHVVLSDGGGGRRHGRVADRFRGALLFNALYDLPVVLVLTTFVFLYVLWREYLAWRARGGDRREPAKFLDAPFDKPVVFALMGGLVAYGVYRVVDARFFGGPAFLTASYDPVALLAITSALSLYLLWRTWGTMGVNLVTFAVAAGLSLGITVFLVRDTWKSFGHSRLLVRNFYGALVVFDTTNDSSMGPIRVLRHGTIDHGEQFLWPQNSRIATTYYAEKSGVGIAIRTLQLQGPMNVGVIGLGAGTLTTYGRPVDHYRVYDINPLVLKIAQTQFTFLRDCPAPHDVVMGDARLSLEREEPQKFDVLAVDAFSGDAIPVHLLTREAFRLYWRHLKPDGVLAVHVSNLYLALGPVVALGAAETGKTAKMVSFETPDDNPREESDSDWVLVTSRPGFFDQPELKGASKIDPIPGLRMWTDDYSNLYRILR